MAFRLTRNVSGFTGFNHLPSRGETLFGISPSEIASAYASQIYDILTDFTHSTNRSRTASSPGAITSALLNVSIALSVSINPMRAHPTRYSALAIARERRIAF